jgi:uncharacterized surface protein with fasciclin (FAS1) repeats
MTIDSQRRTVLKALGGAGVMLTAGVGTAAARKGASAEKTLVELALEVNGSGPYAGAFDTLIAALVAKPDLLEMFATRPGGQYTVFAPTDTAFEALGFNPDNADEIPASILAYHVSPGRRYSESVLGAPRIPTLTDEFLEQDDGVLNGDQASIIVTDLEASNGVLHAIDGVLLPPSALE